MHSAHIRNLRSRQPGDTRAIAIESRRRNRFRFRRWLVRNDFRLFPIVDSSMSPREMRRKRRSAWMSDSGARDGGVRVRDDIRKLLVSIVLVSTDPTGGRRGWREGYTNLFEAKSPPLVAFCPFARFYIQPQVLSG